MCRFSYFVFGQLLIISAEKLAIDFTNVHMIYQATISLQYSIKD